MLARSGGMEIAMEQEKKAWLVLADGTVLEGASFGAQGTATVSYTHLTLPTTSRV